MSSPSEAHSCGKPVEGLFRATASGFASCFVAGLVCLMLCRFWILQIMMLCRNVGLSFLFRRAFCDEGVVIGVVVP